MNDAERISALEGLLVRIQKNAALPRTSRVDVEAQTMPGPLVRASLAASAHAASAKPIVAPQPRVVAVMLAPIAQPRAVVVAPVATVAPVVTSMPAPAAVFTRTAIKPPAAAGVLPPGAGRYGGEPTSRGGFKAMPVPSRAPTLELEMDDPLEFDMDDEPTIMGFLPKLPPMMEAPASVPPQKMPVVAAPTAVAEAIPAPSPSEPAMTVFADDPDISFDDEVTHGSSNFAAARAEAETERLALERVDTERLAAEKTEAERRAEEWRLLELEALHLEAEQRARTQAEDFAQEAAEKEEAARFASAMTEKAEAARLECEAAEATRLAKLAAAQAEAEKAHAERLAAEAEAERLAAEAERERLAAEAEAERLAAEAEAAARAEAERLAAKEKADLLAADAAAKARAERLVAEEQRLAREAAEQHEREAVLQAEAAQRSWAEAQRLAEELAAAATQEAAEEVPPASARQPRDESRPVDEALVLDDEDDEPPASGQVQSQRKPTIHDELTLPASAELSGWEDEETTAAPSALLAAQADEELRIAGKVPLTPPEEPTLRTTAIRSVPPPAARPLELRLAVEAPAAQQHDPIDAAPDIIVMKAMVISRPGGSADVASFIGALRAGSPASFGAMLDESLALGG